MKYLKKYNESIKDYLKPKSSDEINSLIDREFDIYKLFDIFIKLTRHDVQLAKKIIIKIINSGKMNKLSNNQLGYIMMDLYYIEGLPEYDKAYYYILKRLKNN